MEAEVVPILRVADADVAVRWYERLGFTRHQVNGWGELPYGTVNE